MTDSIREALEKLDPTNDTHWTSDGLPRMDIVEELSGDKGLTRAKVTEAQPGFSRAAAIAGVQHGDSGVTPEGTQGGATPWTPAAPQPPITSEEPPSDEGEPSNLRVAYDEAADARQAAEAAYLAAKKAFEKAEREHDKALTVLQESEPAETSGDAIQGYLAQQRNILSHRATRMKALKESGINLADLTRGLRAPIDTAMRRNTARGTKRPGS